MNFYLYEKEEKKMVNYTYCLGLSIKHLQITRSCYSRTSVWVLTKLARLNSSLRKLLEHFFVFFPEVTKLLTMSLGREDGFVPQGLKMSLIGILRVKKRLS